MSQGFALTPEEKIEVKWGNLVILFQNIDRIMSGRNIEVVACDAVKSFHQVAYSDLDVGRIVLNRDVIDISTVDGIAAATGLNYHELCHVLYTPTSIIDRIGSSNTSGQAFNILEDQRIEKIFVDRYEVAANYFTKTIVTYIREAGTNDEFMLFILTHGRTYLPGAMRDGLSKFSLPYDKVLATEAAQIIDEYIKLDLDYETDKRCAVTLVAELSKILDDKYQGAPPTVQCISKASPSPSASDKTFNSELDCLLTVVESAIEPVIAAEALLHQRIISDSTKASNILHNITAPKPLVRRVSQQWQAAATKMADELSRIYIDQEPYWLTHQSSGKLNARRAASGGDPSGMFDEWVDYQEADSSLEAVILVDHSTSMHSMIEESSMSLWALKRAIEANDGRATAIGFNTSAYPLYPDGTFLPSEYNSYRAAGNTDPTEALEAAHIILASSNKIAKLLVVITDGAWCQCHSPSGEITAGMWSSNVVCPKIEPDRLVERINGGATTALFYLSSQVVKSPDSHGCQMASHASTITELHNSVRDLTTSIIKKRW